jgi:hypothetical protein
MLLAERAGFESGHLGREEPSIDANGREADGEGDLEESEEVPSRPPQPKAEGSDAATLAAIKAALDEGRFERAVALLDVLRRTGGVGQVIALEGRCELFARALLGPTAPRPRVRRSPLSGFRSLQNAIVRAVTAGAFDVANVLAAQLEDRRASAHAGKRVPARCQGPRNAAEARR